MRTITFIFFLLLCNIFFSQDSLTNNLNNDSQSTESYSSVFTVNQTEISSFHIPSKHSPTISSTNPVGKEESTKENYRRSLYILIISCSIAIILLTSYLLIQWVQRYRAIDIDISDVNKEEITLVKTKQVLIP